MTDADALVTEASTLLADYRIVDHNGVVSRLLAALTAITEERDRAKAQYVLQVDHCAKIWGEREAAEAHAREAEADASEAFQTRDDAVDQAVKLRAERDALAARLAEMETHHGMLKCGWPLPHPERQP